MSLKNGTRLGPYEILSPLGAGGMGEVYRAHDTRLGRDVAVKVLPEAFVADPERLRRFEQEARSAAALNHPNILVLHDIGSSRVSSRGAEGPAAISPSPPGLPRPQGGLAVTEEAAEPIHYIVTELLEGETLRERLRRGQVPPAKVVELGVQIAQGLAAAHEKGIVHRDLKPENLFVTKDGRIKILDFGLARLLPQDSAQASLLSDAPTANCPTQPGALLGTIGYMSPEQARGLPADARSDIFAFGATLYEMLSGRRAFAGATPADALSAILKEDPEPLAQLVANVPPPLDRLIRHCLQKQQEDRFASARDLAFALEQVVPAQPLGGGTTQGGAGATADRRPAIAVLPFSNLSADPEQEYFCDGMAEEILNALAHVQGLRVIARTSSFAFKGRAEDVRQVGARLDVTTLLEGSVRKSGDRLRITAQLISVADGSHLWSERYDRRIEDVFAIQEEIALAIVEKLRVHLLGRERAAIGRRHTDDMEAYSAYLHGLFHWNTFTPGGFARSRECFEDAVRKDPDYAPALSGLGLWYVSQAFWADHPSEEAWLEASSLIQRALICDRESGFAHTVQGNLLGFFERRWDAAEESLRRGVLYDPGQAMAHFNLASLLGARQRWDEATEEARLSLKLDPLSAPNCAWSAHWLILGGHHDEGRAELERIAALAPNHWLPHWGLAVQAAGRRCLEEARSEAEKALTFSGGASMALMLNACVCLALGDERRAGELQDELRHRARLGHVAPTRFAWLADAERDIDASVGWLERAAAERDPMLCFYRTMPASLLSGDPRIEAVLARFGL